jgi:hypothetical protein
LSPAWYGQSDDRNILEVTREHESREMSRSELASDPESWALKHLQISDDKVRRRLRYYGVTLSPPLYPKELAFPPLPLYDAQQPSEPVTMVSTDEAEYQVAQMASAAGHNPALPRRWLTTLLFDPGWGPHGKPSVFLSYPGVASAEAALIRKTLESRFHIVVLQDADIAHITEGAIERIVKAHALSVCGTRNPAVTVNRLSRHGCRSNTVSH